MHVDLESSSQESVMDRLTDRWTELISIASETHCARAKHIFQSPTVFFPILLLGVINGILIGDGGYQPMKQLLVPYRTPNTAMKQAYNNGVSRGR